MEVEFCCDEVYRAGIVFGWNRRFPHSAECFGVLVHNLRIHRSLWSRGIRSRHKKDAAEESVHKSQIEIYPQWLTHRRVRLTHICQFPSLFVYVCMYISICVLNSILLLASGSCLEPCGNHSVEPIIVLKIFLNRSRPNLRRTHSFTPVQNIRLVRTSGLIFQRHGIERISSVYYHCLFLWVSEHDIDRYQVCNFMIEPSDLFLRLTKKQWCDYSLIFVPTYITRY